MDITYDKSTDTCVIRFNQRSVMHSGELTPGIIADYDKEGAIIRLELLDAGKTIISPSMLNLNVTFSVE